MSEIKELVILMVAIVSIIIGAWILGSALEARAYNRVTGSDVSTFDAMFIKLRVEGRAK